MRIALFPELVGQSNIQLAGKLLGHALLSYFDLLPEGCELSVNLLPGLA